MKTFKIPIFTEEYKVSVFIGTKGELIKAASKYTTYSPKTITRELENRRGLAYDLFPDLDPLILINGELPAYLALSTLAHESCHAVGFIEKFLGIDDRNDEFKSHGIGTIMRTVSEFVLKKVKV